MIVGMGSVILHRFGGAVAGCEGNWSGYVDGVTDGNDTVWNSSTNTCQLLDDGITQNGSGYTPAGTGWVNTDYLLTELGSTGLAGWTPAIVAISVGMLIFGAFLAGGGTGRKY